LLVVTAAASDPTASHRLLTLGWRPGAHVSVIRHSSGGARIVALSGARVAIGGPLCRALKVAVAGGPSGDRPTAPTSKAIRQSALEVAA
jgi:Fe2+ transport system protein FeoA